MLDPVLNTLPQWLIGLMIFSGCLVGREIGGFIYKRYEYVAAATDAEKSTRCPT
jgi:hypothetical protein